MASFHAFSLPNAGGTPISCRRYGGRSTVPTPPALIFTHGAGGTLDSPAMVHFAAGFTSPSNGDVTASPLVCFQGPSNLPARTRMFTAVMGGEQTASVAKKSKEERHRKGVMALGGRSMGARAAVIAATTEAEAAGIAPVLVLVSYPLRAPGGGKGAGAMRDGILRTLPADAEVLFVSGDGDSMCDLAELEHVRGQMSARTWLVKVRDADHGMSVKPKKGTQVVGEEVGRLVAEWLRERDDAATEAEVFFDKDAATAERSAWAQKRPPGKGRERAPPTPQNVAKEEPKKDVKKVKGKVEKDKPEKAAAKGTKRPHEDEQLPPSSARQSARRKKST